MEDLNKEIETKVDTTPRKKPASKPKPEPTPTEPKREVEVPAVEEIPSHIAARLIARSKARAANQ